MENKTLLENIYPCGPTTERMEAILALYIVAVRGAFSNSRRQWGGYAYTHSYSGTSFYSIVVYSYKPETAVSGMDEYIESYRDKVAHDFAQMSEEDFEALRGSVSDGMLPWGYKGTSGATVCKSIEIGMRRCNYECKIVDVIKALKKQDIIDFCENEKRNPRKLCIQIIEEEIERTEPRSEAKHNKYELTHIRSEGEPTTIVDINEFRKNLNVYPLRKVELEADV